MALDVDSAMDLIGAALGTITGLRVYPYPADKVAPPAALVQLASVEYDAATMRHADRAVFNIWLVVGETLDRLRAAEVNRYLSGVGAGHQSVKAAVDAIGGANVRVRSAEPTAVNIAGTTYRAGSMFEVDFIA